jgi:hypothetical protein
VWRNYLSKKFIRTLRKLPDGSKTWFLLTSGNYHYSVLKDLYVQKICFFFLSSGFRVLPVLPSVFPPCGDIKPLGKKLSASNGLGFGNGGDVMAIVTLEISAVDIKMACNIGGSYCDGERQISTGSLDGSRGSVGSTRDGNSG